MASSFAIGVPTEVLVAADGFGGRFTATEVAEALVLGLAASGQPARVSRLDEQGMAIAPPASEIRAARAVIMCADRLDRESLVGSLLSEVATTARQAGVPCHAVVGSNQLDLFDIRILDLQLVIEATALAEIEAAGVEIGAAMQADLALGA
jgi:glycerate kinase